MVTLLVFMVIMLDWNEKASKKLAGKRSVVWPLCPLHTVKSFRDDSSVQLLNAMTVKACVPAENRAHIRAHAPHHTHTQSPSHRHSTGIVWIKIVPLAVRSASSFFFFNTRSYRSRSVKLNDFGAISWFGLILRLHVLPSFQESAVSPEVRMCLLSFDKLIHDLLILR